MHKGHHYQERQGIRSTKLKEPSNTLQSTAKNKILITLATGDADLLHKYNRPAPIEQRTTTFYFACQEATGKFYTDPTRRFLVPSTNGNEYILCGYDYDSNNLFAEPMKNREKAIQIKSVTTIIRKIKAARLRPTFHILNNEVSTDLIEFLETDEKITVQLAPAGCHRRNAAEQAIRMIKNHFIAGLCTEHKTFP